MPAIFPDMMAPVVRRAPDGDRELVMLRWGLRRRPRFSIRGVTNVRNVGSPHWRRWTGYANRCLVPATSFCEPSTHPDPATGERCLHIEVALFFLQKQGKRRRVRTELRRQPRFYLGRIEVRHFSLSRVISGG
jgi:putative SOS response-associated peptidase YedK